MIAKRYIKRVSLFFILIKDRLFGSNKKFDPNTINNLILIVGPYRNLTTYFASILSIHPNISVLNHAGIRVFKNANINFLRNYSLTKYHNFLRFFDYAIKSGHQGMRGGSIQYSHAFKSNEKLQHLFQQKSEQQNSSSSFVWKESQMVSNHFLENPTEFQKILDQNKAIKFLFPIRHPLDCVKSNLVTNKHQFFKLGHDAGVDKLMDVIFEEYLFFLQLKKQHTQRVFFIFEHKISETTITNLCNFCNVTTDDSWLKTTLEEYRINKHYEHSSSELETTTTKIKSLFTDYPNFQKELLLLMEKSN